MRVEVTVSVDVTPTTRMHQISSMFDAPIAAKASRSWSADVPIDQRPWSVGLIVGPSGSGKTTVARQLFGAEQRIAWDHRSIVDNFDADLSIEQIADALSAVGFNTIPAWLRPFETLSNGERFRCMLARLLSTRDELVWMDEFTSVVDRQVARIASHAVARYVRSQSGRQFVAVGCHYDVIDWLQPDWILEPALMTFTWRSLQRRPGIAGIIKRASHDLWTMFAPHHYLTADLHRGARCFAAYVNDRPIAFAATLSLPVSNGRRAGESIVRVSRVVVLPDWQGCGLAFRLLESIGAAYTALGLRYRNYPAHPAFVRAHQRKPTVWRQVTNGATALTRQSSRASHSSSVGRHGGRPCSVFEYIGDKMDLSQAERLLALG